MHIYIHRCLDLNTRADEIEVSNSKKCEERSTINGTLSANYTTVKSFTGAVIVALQFLDVWLAHRKHKCRLSK